MPGNSGGTFPVESAAAGAGRAAQPLGYIGRGPDGAECSGKRAASIAADLTFGVLEGQAVLARDGFNHRVDPA